jgi:hypothetical protein
MRTLEYGFVALSIIVLDPMLVRRIMKESKSALSEAKSLTIWGGEPGSTGCLKRLVACRGWSAGLVKSRPKL